MSFDLWDFDPFVTSLDPWRELRRMRKELDRLGGTSPALLEGRTGGGGGGQLVQQQQQQGGLGLWRPRVDVRETDKNYLITADLPGVPQDQLKIDFDNGALRISGEKKEEKKEENERFVRTERFYGRFERMLPLPEGIDPSQIKANYDNGVLSVEVPKPAQPTAKRIEIQASSKGGQETKQGGLEVKQGQQQQQGKNK